MKIKHTTQFRGYLREVEVELQDNVGMPNSINSLSEP